MSLCTCVLLFVKNGFTVGQKSFDLQKTEKYIPLNHHLASQGLQTDDTDDDGT